jgi:hypothetical protein
MKRIMLDLETLDTGPHSVIISIGAVEFDAGVVTDYKFYTAVQHEHQEARWSRTTGEKAKQWWSQQSEAARFVLVDPAALPLDRALLAFSMWMNGVASEMWGNGSDFDNVILGNAYEACRLARPWSYSANRCYRTLKNLGIVLGPGEGTVREGTHHNALDDALYQAHYAAAWLKRLNMGMTTLLSLEAHK